MIHEVAKEIDAVLRSRGCPLRVLDGPEPTKTTTYARERIVVEHDEDASDSFASPKTQSINPKLYSIRQIAAKATFYTQVVSPGAMEFEHRRRAEHAVDMFVVALYEVAALRKNAFAITGGKFVQPADLKDSETIGGAVYELKFTIERGIRALTWAGDKRPEAVIGGTDGVKIKSRTDVVLENGNGDEPETSCGG